jgi:hypothetical protein
VLPRMESLPAFLARVRSLPKPRKLLGDLILEDSTGLWHGQPRSSKSLVLLEAMLAMAQGKVAAFGLEMLRAPESIPVAYVGEEDSERRVEERISWLLAGRGRKNAPRDFHLWVRQGVSIDEAQWQDWVIREANRLQIQFLGLDPFRGLTLQSDQGPAELAPVVRFLSRFRRETSCSAIGLIHHDVKPAVDKRGVGLAERNRSQQASGGGIFSISDAPICLERLSPVRFQVTPEDFKFSEDPAPFYINLEIEQSGNRIVAIRLLGEEMPEGTTAKDVNEEVFRSRIVDHLKVNPWLSIRAIASGLQKNRDDVTTSLERMKRDGHVLECAGERKARLWAVVGTPMPRASLRVSGQRGK